MRKHQEGFTLVELMVTIVCVSVVTFAVMSFMLMGTRVSAASTETAGRQQTVRIVLTMLEKMAGSGQIETVKATGLDWQLLDSSNSALLQYDAVKKTLSAGSSVLLEDLRMAQAELNGSLLTVCLETEDGVYESSVYCRTTTVREEGTGSGEILNKVDNETAIPVSSGMTGTEKAGRYAFLAALATQYGSKGRIRNTDGTYGWYYSQWYCNPATGAYWDGWNEKTPWCACFASWAMDKISDSLQAESLPRFSAVTNGVEMFQRTDHKYGTWLNSGAVPTPGDLIFFDWLVPENPDHVGVVLYVDIPEDEDESVVYTIEGNSGGRVAVCAYYLNDTRILGYGVLNWKTE